MAETARPRSSVTDAALARVGSASGGGDAIDLSVGEPDVATPPRIVEAGIAALRAGETRYTPRAGYGSLRCLLADKLAQRNGYAADPDDIVVTGGGTPAVAIAIGAACRPGDGILLPDPSWPNYQVFAERLGLRISRYRQDPAEGVAFDLDEIEALVDERTRMVVINSPSNPTGGVADERLVRGLVALAERHDLLICSDEAYEDIAFGVRPLSPAAAGGKDRTFACYTFSKTYAMTGWRVGYVVVPPTHRQAALAMQISISGCASAMGQRAAEVAAGQEHPEVAQAVVAYRERRDRAVALLAEHGVPTPTPAGAFYLWVDVGASGLTGAAFTARLRDERGVLVSAGETYSEQQSSRIRVSFATEQSLLVEGLGRVVDLVRSP